MCHAMPYTLHKANPSSSGELKEELSDKAMKKYMNELYIALVYVHVLA